MTDVPTAWRHRQGRNHRLWLRYYIDSIRHSAEETMRLATEEPEAVIPTLADIPDQTWRAMVLTLRYSDNHQVAQRLGNEHSTKDDDESSIT